MSQLKWILVPAMFFSFMLSAVGASDSVKEMRKWCRKPDVKTMPEQLRKSQAVVEMGDLQIIKSCKVMGYDKKRGALKLGLVFTSQYTMGVQCEGKACKSQGKF